MLPLEKVLEKLAADSNNFPQGGNFFLRYQQIKTYLETKIYPDIAAGTSSEDGGIYTDHSAKHFNEVIRYAGLLLNLDPSSLSFPPHLSALNPYEVFITLVAILLHDAGNIHGRKEHEKKALHIFLSMGDAVCTDHFEARLICKIAQAHGGYHKLPNGDECKDTIGPLEEQTAHAGIAIRPRLIAAIVRFADEICESRNRASSYLQKTGGLPEFSEIYHKYASSISSSTIDHQSKAVVIKYEMKVSDISQTYGSGSAKKVVQQHLTEEIFVRLEKMYKELQYCKRFMYDLVKVAEIHASLTIYSDKDYTEVKSKRFILKEQGYPQDAPALLAQHPDWAGIELQAEHNQTAT